jgi:hypothetical protein
MPLARSPALRSLAHSMKAFMGLHQDKQPLDIMYCSSASVLDIRLP